jgi:hypothetical protein
MVRRRTDPTAQRRDVVRMPERCHLAEAARQPLPKWVRHLDVSSLHGGNPWRCDAHDQRNASSIRRQLVGLLKFGFECWSLSKLIEAQRESKTVPPNVFAITFDDGYENNFFECLADPAGVEAASDDFPGHEISRFRPAISLR